MNKKIKKIDKIFFVIGSLVRGGAEKVIVTLANEYANEGWNVSIIILLFRHVDWNLNPNVKIIDFVGNNPSRAKRVLFWIRSMNRLFKQNPGSIIVSFVARINLLVLLSAKKSQHRIILSERNDPRFDGRGKIVKFMVFCLYPKADTIVFQTKDCAKLFSKKIQDKGVVIPNPLKITDFAPVCPSDPTLLISAGRLAYQKDFQTMIRAMPLIVSKHPNIRLEIYGDGDQKECLDAMIRSLSLIENVHLFPNTANIQEKMRTSFLYLSTSLYEGMSNSLMEASMSGIPCICTPCLGTDFIEEGHNGFFIDFKKPTQLAERINFLLDNKTEYVRIRNEALTIAKNTPEFNSMEVWKETIESK